ncbi:MAG: P1 family peptidase [Bilophila wadsworthia]
MRIRDIARIDGFPCGEYNAVTDVKGVRVGHSTVIKDGAGPVEGIARTGVTVVLPAGDIVENAMYAGVFSLNGNGELSGCHWIEESGLLTTPIALTNTHSLGIVRDAMIDYYARLRKTDGSSYWMLPVVGETWDGWLSDINGMHVRPEHLCAALDSAASGPVAEGCVGGGTGMISMNWAASDQFPRAPRGARRLHRGRAHPGQLRQARGSAHQRRARGQAYPHLAHPRQGTGAPAHAQRGRLVIIVVATDAPLTPDQCKRLARRAGPGLGRRGLAFDGSGDISSPFPPPTGLAATPGRPRSIPCAPCRTGAWTPFRATVEATHEAIITPCARRRTRTASWRRTRCRSTRCAGSCGVTNPSRGRRAASPATGAAAPLFP